MRNRLTELGFSEKDTMPELFQEDYEPVWYRYIQTQAVKDLIGTVSDTVAKNYLLAAGFASYLETYDSVGYEFASDVSALLSAQFKNTVNLLNDVLRRFRLLDGLKPVKMTHDVEYTRSDMLNVVLGVHVEGFVWLESKDKRSTLHDLLQALKGSLYVNDLPEKLKISKYTDQQLMSSDALWYRAYADQQLKLYVGRTRGATLMLRYECEYRKLPLFYGNQFKAVDKAVTDLWSSLLKIG